MDGHDHSGVFHTHAPVGKMKQAFIFTLVILVVEFSGGLISHSLALLSDAGHVLTDLAAIGLSWYAINQSNKPPTENLTYGYHRTGILAALINGIALIFIAIVIIIEAYHRLLQPEPVHSLWMIVSAGIGLSINLYLGLGLRGEENLNVRSAVLHMLGDAAASAGVILGAVLILYTKWYLVDPILSVLISLLIALGAWHIVKQAINILMEGAPKGISLSTVATAIRQIQGVYDVHDLHIWSITSGKNALSCHVVLDGTLSIRDSQAILRNIEHELIHLGIGHSTIQMEDAGHPHPDSVLCADDASHQGHGHCQ
ncbi:cation diffusion facilitator family transporter [Sulfoacidibacillus thermotolerans]|uniref:Cation diffusion facilitator family transporter n=2 Tax=Sulfoacidibacillus thermotolerans TaxID=1765684 RepID=A0A2U3D6Q4_SULT2|nr:cation diffusion facilitator family transporter [Sulfoacidibacillus thermotolerans]